ncbi:MAG: GntR family transcriptional regulator [Pseudomonadota bacterium]
MSTEPARVSQVQRALHELREMVLTCALPPGSMHLEVELAKMLGMSRTPVREAAIILEGRGLVELRPRRGMRVLPVSVEDMREIYEVLTALEPVAAETLARRGLTEAEDESFEEDLQAMERALQADDREAWAMADEAFHARLVEAAGNRRATEICMSLADQVHRARLMTLHFRDTLHVSNADHRMLIEAIREGDPEKAYAQHRRHRIGAGGKITALIEERGLRSV